MVCTFLIGKYYIVVFYFSGFGTDKSQQISVVICTSKRSTWIVVLISTALLLPEVVIILMSKS